MSIFSDYTIALFKKHTNTDLNKYRTNQTRFYDNDGLLFLDWSLVPESKKVQIKNFAMKNSKTLQFNNLGCNICCIAQVKH